jgi:hypothetical protein
MAMDFSAAGKMLGFGGFDFGRTGIAASDAGGLGNLLRQQASDETEEARRKRMLGLDPRQSGIGMPGTSAAGRTLFSSILGGMR